MIASREALVARYAPGVDAHGAPIDAWGQPAPVLIHGWAPTTNDQPIEGNRRPTISEITIYAPAVVGGPRARWTLGADLYEQVGHAASYANGPWWRDAGVAIKARRIEG